MINLPQVEPPPLGMYAQSTSEVTLDPNGKLGKEDFLTILVATMKDQDPLNPIDNGEMIAQMAQFSSLEAMLNMAESLVSVQSLALLGRTVTSIAVDGSLIEGVAVSVNMNNGGEPIVTLNDGSVVAMRDIQEVKF